MEVKKTNSFLKRIKEVMQFIHTVLLIYVLSMTEMLSPAYEKALNSSTLATSPNLISKAIFDSTEESSGIFLTNNGSGPLVFKNVSISHKKESMPYQHSHELKSDFHLNPSDFDVSLIQNDQFMEKGEIYWLVKSKSNSAKHSRAAKYIANNITISLCYCSTNGRCSHKVIGYNKNINAQCEKYEIKSLYDYLLNAVDYLSQVEENSRKKSNSLMDSL